MTKTTVPELTGTVIPTVTPSERGSEPTPMVTPTLFDGGLIFPTPFEQPPIAGLEIEMPLQLAFSETFDNTDWSYWRYDEGWLVVETEFGQSLQARNTDVPLSFAVGSYYDMAIEARVQWTGSMFYLSGRQSEAGAYALMIDNTGSVNLLKGGNALATAPMQMVRTDSTWHALRMDINGSRITVTIDGVAMLSVADSSPLPPGTFALGTGRDGSLIVDDIRLYTADGQIPPSPFQQAQALVQDRIRQYQAEQPPVIETMNSGCIGPAQSSATLIGADEGFVDGGDVRGLCEAISFANTRTATTAYRIYLGRGTYNIQNHLTFQKGVQLWGVGADETIIQPAPTFPQIGLMTVQANSVVEMRNITIRNGSANSPTTSQDVGGAIRQLGGTLNIIDSKLNNNTASLAGGVLWRVGGVTTFQRVYIRSNTAQIGGALYLAAGTTPLAECLRFHSNDASGGGGAMLVATGVGQAFGNQNGRTNSVIQGSALSSISRFIWNNTAGSANTLDVRGSFWSHSPVAPIWVNDNNRFTVFPASSNGDLTAPYDSGSSSNPNPFYNVNMGACAMRRGATQPNYNVDVIFNGGTTGSNLFYVQEIQRALEIVGGALPIEYGYTRAPQFSGEPDVARFRQVMLGDNQNRIVFVFYDIPDGAASVPNNWNAPNTSQRQVDYRGYSRACPFFLSLTATAGNGLGGTLSNNTQPLPTGLQQILQPSPIWTQPIQALIVCDTAIPQATGGPFPFERRTVVYNLGLVFLFENGGVGGAYYNTIQNTPIMDNQPPPTGSQVVMGTVSVPECTGLGDPRLNVNLVPGCMIGSVTVTDWQRGQRGWGNAAPSVLLGSGNTADVMRGVCLQILPNDVRPFQQNPVETIVGQTAGPNADIGGNAPAEFIATAGDMFLNWAFRVLGNTTAFGNYDWRTQVICPVNMPAANAAGAPGTARSVFMDGTALPSAVQYFRPFSP